MLPRAAGNRPKVRLFQAQTGEKTMTIRSFQRSIRFTKSEWDAIIEAAEKAKMTPGAFVRKAAARAAADDLYLYGGGLTPELAELIKRTFRGVHLLTWLRREELDRNGKDGTFDQAVKAAQIAQDEAMGEDEHKTET